MKYETKLDVISLVREPRNFEILKEINSFAKICDVAREIYGNSIDIHESFFCFFLNNSLDIVGIAKIGQGGITECNVDIRLICKYAISTLATNVACIHNHPSGKLEASASDLSIAKKIQKALELFNIRLLDSIIITKDSEISY